MDGVHVCKIYENPPIKLRTAHIIFIDNLESAIAKTISFLKGTKLTMGECGHIERSRKRRHTEDDTQVSNAEIYDGCPLVRPGDDSPEDLAHILKILTDVEYVLCAPYLFPPMLVYINIATFLKESL